MFPHTRLCLPHGEQGRVRFSGGMTMADGKRLYIMAGFDQETERRLGRWETLLERGHPGPQTKGIPHHITLGAYPPEMEEQVRAMVAQAARETAPFPVCFDHLGLLGGGRVLFAAPSVDHALLSLKERFGPCAGWAAHATLLIDEPETVLSAVGPAIGMFEAFEGRVERIFLHEFFPNCPILHLPLEGGN